MSALRGFSERETQAFQTITKDYKYKNNININIKPKIIAKHLLAVRFYNTKIMIWYKLKEKRPLAYKTGLFDGKKSDKVLVADQYGKYHIAEMYEGVLDGSEFCDFYDQKDFEIKNVEYWTEIDSPF